MTGLVGRPASLPRPALLLVVPVVLAALAGTAGCGNRGTSSTQVSSPGGLPPATGVAPSSTAPPDVGPAPLEEPADGGPTGSLGWALLAPDHPEVILEVDTAEGLDAPTGSTLEAAVEAAVEAVSGALERHGHKRVLRAGDSRVPAQGIYSAADLQRLAASHRKVRSEPGVPAVYLLVLPGRFETSTVTGTTLGATGMAVFPESVARGVAGSEGSDRPPAPFVAATAAHQLGHLFGLVGLTGTGDFHEDAQHPTHAKATDSVMYWAVETTSAPSVFRTLPPARFTALDEDEMARIAEIRPPDHSGGNTAAMPPVLPPE